MKSLKKIINIRKEGRKQVSLIGSTGSPQANSVQIPNQNKYGMGQRGQTAILLTILFLVITLAIVFGFSRISISQAQITRDLINSKRSFATSESGIEDVTYRLQTGYEVGATEFISINGGTTTVSVTDVGLDKKELESGSSIVRSHRSTKTILQKVAGSSFTFGAYVGFEGLKMEETSQIFGSVYSNGSIDGKEAGGDKSLIVGEVWIAGGISDIPDQEMYPGANPTPPPPITLFMGDIDERKYGAQSFVPTVSMKPYKISVLVKKVDNPDKIRIEIVEDDNGIPKEGGNKGRVDLRREDASSSYEWVDLIFSDPKTLNAGNTYWIRMKAEKVKEEKYWNFWGETDTSYSGGTFLYAKDKKDDDWYAPPGKNQGTPTPADMAFRIYFGGDPTFLKDVLVKTNETGPPACLGGGAHATSILNSDLWVDAYYDSDITGSTLNCSNNSGQSDPAPVSPPISDAQIDAWKAEGDAGGTHSGLLEVNGSGTYGPLKIDGELRVKGNSTLTLTGTLHVTGKGTFQDNCIVELDPSYGENSGVIVMDGQVDIGDKCEFKGSGDPRSYLIVLTTNSNLVDPYAMRVNKKSKGAVFYASKGGIELKDNVELKAVYAEKLVMKNNVVLRYEEGIANIIYVVGPEGTYNIRSWLEVE